MNQLSQYPFGTDFVDYFPGDDSEDATPRQTPGMLYSRSKPTPVAGPKLVAWNHELASELGIEPASESDVRVLAGNALPPGAIPFAMCYGGHQFGNWAGQLGDGRAINLGSWTAGNKKIELQLKGAGPTAYSRHADGRAVLRSSVREYLISEAMHHLRVPTTRALSLVTTGDQVLRDMFYDGHPKYEAGAIVCRTSPSFLRFGNFEILAARDEIQNLKDLLNWTIARYYPQIQGEKPVLNWFQEVVNSTALLMAEWQRVGFVHGVMNTDNMSIHGLTIDYGPFSFIDDYDPSFTPNTTDLPGRRYAFGNQPSIGYWNLGKLASALSVVVEDTDPLEQILHSYEDAFWNAYYAMMGKKLGLDQVKMEDKKLIAEFEKVLGQIGPDMTLFYRLLAAIPIEGKDGSFWKEYFSSCFYTLPTPTEMETFFNLINRYQMRLKGNEIPRHMAQEIMNRNNPRIILRNYQLHQAIQELEKGHTGAFENLEKALKKPYAHAGFDDLVQKRPDWAQKEAGCSMLSCSS